MGAAALLLLALAAASCLRVRPAARAQSSQHHRMADCPERCACTTWLELPRASCTGLRLYSVHTGVSRIVQALDLSNNSISNLEDRQLSRAGLTRLKYLNLSMNAISEIGPYAFQDLNNLTVLDLSMNHIDYIAPDTFYDNQNLRILHLANNKFNRHVPELHSLSLTELNLRGCRINQLLPETFVGVKRLRKLDLSDNVLMELDADVLRVMPYLRSLSLGQNTYWACNGVMYELKVYMHDRGIRGDRVCEISSSLPNRLEKMISMKALTAEPEPEPAAAAATAAANNKPTLEGRAAKDPWDVDAWRELEEAVQEQEKRRENEAAAAAAAGTAGIFAGALGNVSPFWLMLIGFLMGSGATMAVTYLWLSTTISCLIPRIRRAEAADSPEATSQRVSLLSVSTEPRPQLRKAFLHRHLWQQENLSNPDDSGNGGGGNGSHASVLPAMAPSCPGTPPPPYREVMLHRNLYPRMAMAAAAAQHQQHRASPVYNV